MSVIYVKGKDWNALRQKLYATGQDVYQAQDTVVAKTAATARPKAFDIEEQYVEHGKEQFKFYKKGTRKTKTIWNSKGKYWQSAGGRRLMQFNFENKASRYAKGARAGQLKPNVISRVSFYSLTANLWEKSTKPYSRKSPKFGSNGRTGVWQTGSVRMGKKYFLTKVYSVVESSIPEAVAKTEEKVFTREKGYE